MKNLDRTGQCLENKRLRDRHNGKGLAEGLSWGEAGQVWQSWAGRRTKLGASIYVCVLSNEGGETGFCN